MHFGKCSFLQTDPTGSSLLHVNVRISMTLLTSGELQLKSDTAEFLRPEKNLPLRFPWKRIGLRRRAPVRTRPGYVYNRRRSAGMLKSVRTMLGNIVDLLMISLISSSGFLTAASFIADFIFRNWMKSWLLLVSFQSRGVYLTSESNAIASHVEVKVGAFCGFYHLRSLW